MKRWRWQLEYRFAIQTFVKFTGYFSLAEIFIVRRPININCIDSLITYAAKIIYFFVGQKLLLILRLYNYSHYYLQVREFF